MSDQPKQRTLAELRDMSVEQIKDAHEAFELEDILAGRDPDTEQVTLERFKAMSPEQRIAARKAGRLTSLGIAR